MIKRNQSMKDKASKVAATVEDDEDEDIEEEVENKVFTKENMHRLLDDEEDNGLF